MAYLILMLAVAAAMALFREPLSRELVHFIETVPWKRLAALAVVLFLMWLSLHTFHVGFVAPLSGDILATLFDTAVVYADLLIAVAFAVLNRQMRQLIGRAADLACVLVHLAMRRASRSRRSPARRRPPDRDDPEPAAVDGILGFA